MLEDTRVVDVHHHFLPRVVFDELKAEAGGARRLLNDKISMALTDQLHQVDRHLGAMDEAGVDAAILTNSGVSVYGSDTCRKLNDGLAEVQRANPGRLYGAAHVALQEPDAAPRELERGARELGLVAVALPTSAFDVNLDNPSLGPLWRTITALDLTVILHPAMKPQGATTDYGLERSCGRPFDTTIAAARLMYGVLPEFPSLRFVLPHLGGTAIFLKGRLLAMYEPPGWEIPAEIRQIAKTQREQRALGVDAVFEAGWSRFYFDTAGTGAWAPPVQLAAEVVGASRLVFGTDYPLESHSGATMRELAEMVGGLRLSREERQAIAGRTAAELFPL